MQITADDVARQQQHKFATQTVHFDSKPDRQGFVETLEVDPATEYKGHFSKGIIRVIANNEGVGREEYQRRMAIGERVQQQITSEAGGEFYPAPNIGTIAIFSPPDGVITTDYVNTVLQSLHNQQAISAPDITSAKHKLGISSGPVEESVPDLANTPQEKAKETAQKTAPKTDGGIPKGYQAIIDYIAEKMKVTQQGSRFSISAKHGNPEVVDVLESALRQYNNKYDGNIGIKRIRSHLEVRNPGPLYHPLLNAARSNGQSLG